MKKLTLLFLFVTSVLSAQTYVDVQMGYPFVESPPEGAKFSSNYGIAHHFKWGQADLSIKAGQYSVAITGPDLNSVDLLLGYSPFNNFEIAAGLNYDLHSKVKAFEMEVIETFPIVNYVDLILSATNVFFDKRNVLSVNAGIRFRIVGKELLSNKRGKHPRFF